MNFDQAALVELFRQSMSPLTYLSGSRLALQQGALERENALRQRMALMDEENRLATGRALALEGAQAQSAQLLQQRNADAQRELALELQGLNAQAQLAQAAATTGAAGYWNNKAAEAARTASNVAGARQMAASLGIDIDPEDPDYVNKVTVEAGRQMATHRKSATQYFRELSTLGDQLNAMTEGVDVPQARQLQIAKSILLSGGLLDKKQQEKFKTLDNLQAVLDAAEGVGAGEKIEQALVREQMLRNQTFEKKARPIQTRMGQLQRTLQALESRGISPDFEAVLAPAASRGSASTGESELPALTSADVDSLLPRPSAGTPPASASRATSNSLPATIGGLTLMGALRGGGLSSPAPLAGAGLLRTLGVVGGGLAVGKGLGDAIEDVSGGAPSSFLAGIAEGRSTAEEAQRQHAELATIDRLVRQAQATGDADTARKLRALRYAPRLDTDAIFDALPPRSRLQWRSPSRPEPQP